MKKFLTLLVGLFFSMSIFADDTAKINIKLNGNLKENRLFLCFTSVGCLSIKHAQQGKIYPMYREFKLMDMYVTDMGDGGRLHRQNLPSSCAVNVDLNKTLTIVGNLTLAGKDHIQISQLRCNLQ